MPKNGGLSNRSDASSARSLLGDTSRSHESKHSEKSEGSSKPAEKDPLRYLNEAHFLEAMEGFNKYDPEEWLPTLTVDMSEFMRGPFIVVTVVTMACTILTVVVPATLPLFSLQSDAHVVLGGALSFLIVFRTNSSYDRWWEARKTWQEVINTCRTFAVAASGLRDPAAGTRLVCESCMCFVLSLKSHLREEPISEEELGGLLDWDRIEELNGFTCPPFIAANQLNDIVEDVSILPDNPAIAKVVVDTFASQVEQLLDSIGKCEQIKDTPMVFGYVATLRSFLMLWLITLPLALIGEYGWIATPAMALITFLFLNVEQMALEIEQPFGDDPNDLPIEEYILALEKEMLEMIADYDKKAEEAKVGAEEPDSPADSPPKIVPASDAPSYRLAVPTAPIGGKDVRLRSPRKKAEAEVLEA